MTQTYAQLIAAHAETVSTWMTLSIIAPEVFTACGPSQEAADTYNQLVELSTLAYTLFEELENVWKPKGKLMPKGALML